MGVSTDDDVRLQAFQFVLEPFSTEDPLAIGVEVTIQVVDTLVFLLLASNRVQKLNVFREDFKTIYRKSRRWINFFFWVFFIVSSLRIFRIKDAFFQWGEKVLTTGSPFYFPVPWIRIVRTHLFDQLPSTFCCLSPKHLF